ncbi:hypothetical protein OGV82_11930 [Citrobacter sp. CK191]|uniref:hypothetical protein n=1 Tax=Citrobacter TaxID=544 RepID=UPI002578BEC0|nr:MULTISPECIES: hypothetical protein [Citrobacter]MDM3008292.1 hypothetical protein [Citrobacter sp. CK191]
MVWDIRTATNYAKHHAHTHSIKKCAEYTRKAIRAGGIDIEQQNHNIRYTGGTNAIYSPINPFTVIRM